jgi:hypothetical protein
MRCCCRGGDSSPGASGAMPRNPGRASWFQRVVVGAEWAVPVATLIMIPKCPACVAAYVLLFTGIGLSWSAASTLRWALIVLSVAVLMGLCVRAVRRVRVRSS